MRILLIEDDKRLCEALSFQLQKEGFYVDICHDGEEGLLLIRPNAYDLVLLDRMLPGYNGFEVLKAARGNGITTPILLLTALGELQDKVEGLDLGADDYIVKPFAFEELMARIRCINRRPKLWEGQSALTFGDISFDSESKQLTNENGCCTLSKKETELMGLFLRNPGQILPRDMLLSRIWGPDSDIEDGNLDNYIHFLRRRLKSVDSRLSIKTIRGTGYCLEDSSAS